MLPQAPGAQHVGPRWGRGLSASPGHQRTAAVSRRPGKSRWRPIAAGPPGGLAALKTCKTNEQVTKPDWLASRWSDCTDQRVDLVAAGVPVEPYTLRATHVFRREDGEWKIVHRHGDHPPTDQSRPGEASPE